MLAHHEAFAAGYLPSLCGAYFRLVELFAAHAEHPEEEVRKFIAQEITKLRETGVGVISNIRRVEQLAKLAGFEAPPPPRFPQDYHGWFGEVHHTFYNDLTLHEKPEICFRAAFHAGSILADWNLLTVTLALLQRAPNDDQLRNQSRKGFAEMRDRLDELRITVKHPNAPEALIALATRVTDCMDFASIAKHVLFKKDGSLNAGEIETMMATLQQQMPKILEKAQEMEEVLKG